VAADVSRAQRAQGYLEFLAEEGYRPRLDPDGDVVFKVEGGIYYILLDEDEAFFRLVYPTSGPWRRRRSGPGRSGRRSRSRRGEGGQGAARRGGAGRGGDVLFPPEAVHPVIQRSIRAIQDAVREFRAAMLAAG
jgi:hypothetical protein